ncbi:hypothetical protein [Bacillus suaedaesalsae]|uniref:Spore coat protein n=1 Tax=Bacillus suaedaesalsae TaxID=2810349 RepID=A0ABS2DKD0_9BACI|nr:hypothetical protein [Bacillus suaedaesalsae]MBM6618965.1 hypothetical protein [Bacillus suaedaesalsae]
MILPAIDVQLMNEHLRTHEGVLYKLRIYYHHAKNPILKEIIQKQYMVMLDHVRVMLELLNPNRTTDVKLAPIQVDIVPSPLGGPIADQDKPLAIEGRATGQNMANMNFMSALMMKNSHVKAIHKEMALQQSQLQESYSRFLSTAFNEKPPMSSPEEQLTIINRHKHLLKKS